MAIPPFWGVQLWNKCSGNVYDQTGINRKWKIQDGGLLTSITYISAFKQESNEIRSNGYAYIFGVQLSNK